MEEQMTEAQRDELNPLPKSVCAGHIRQVAYARRRAALYREENIMGTPLNKDEAREVTPKATSTAWIHPQAPRSELRAALTGH